MKKSTWTIRTLGLASIFTVGMATLGAAQSLAQVRSGWENEVSMGTSDDQLRVEISQTQSKISNAMKSGRYDRFIIYTPVEDSSFDFEAGYASRDSYIRHLERYLESLKQRLAEMNPPTQKEKLSDHRVESKVRAETFNFQSSDSVKIRAAAMRPPSEVLYNLKGFMANLDKGGRIDGLSAHLDFAIASLQVDLDISTSYGAYDRILSYHRNVGNLVNFIVEKVAPLSNEHKHLSNYAKLFTLISNEMESRGYQDALWKNGNKVALDTLKQLQIDILRFYQENFSANKSAALASIILEKSYPSGQFQVAQNSSLNMERAEMLMQMNKSGSNPSDARVRRAMKSQRGAGESVRAEEIVGKARKK